MKIVTTTEPFPCFCCCKQLNPTPPPNFHPIPEDYFLLCCDYCGFIYHMDPFKKEIQEAPIHIIELCKRNQPDHYNFLMKTSTEKKINYELAKLKTFNSAMNKHFEA